MLHLTLLGRFRGTEAGVRNNLRSQPERDTCLENMQPYYGFAVSTEKKKK